MIVGVLAAIAYADRVSYRHAVAEQAAMLGYDSDSLTYPAHWPLERYLDLAGLVAQPDSVEKLVTGADSVVYFEFPAVDAEGVATLVQVFYFRVGPRNNAVQVTHRHGSVYRVDGSDWLPAIDHRRPRSRALQWYREQTMAGNCN
jgi:hypothetical protein